MGDRGGRPRGVAQGRFFLIIAFVFFWVRFTYPRFREDQLQQFAWKVLIPISLLNIMVTAIFKVAF